jgi:hypothetical protein
MEVHELIIDSWRARAARRLVADFDRAMTPGTA